MNPLSRLTRLFVRNPMATAAMEEITPERVQQLVERAALANGLTADQKHLLLRTINHLYQTGLPWRQLVAKAFGAAARMANNRDRRTHLGGAPQ